MHPNPLDNRITHIWSAWSSFWFTPSLPTLLGVIRILTGAIACYTAFAYTFNLQELMGENAWLDLQLRQQHYRQLPNAVDSFSWSFLQPPLTPEEAQFVADWGYNPRLILSTGRPLWSVWFHITDPVTMNIVHGGIVLSCLLFTLGFCTRVTAALTWFGMLSYVHRAPASVFGADTMLAVLLLYLMIGPSGAVYSVDRLIARLWAKRQGLAAPEVTPSVSAGLAIRLIQVHTCVIYGSAGLAKLQGMAWWTGVAPWYTLANFEYAPMEIPFYVEVLRFLAGSRWLYETTMTIGALGTLVFEIAYPFAIWRPALRNLWLWAALLLHLGIGSFMGLRTFSLLMVAFNLAFVAPETVRWALGILTPGGWKPSKPAATDAVSVTTEEPASTTAIKRHGKPVKAAVATHVKRKH